MFKYETKNMLEIEHYSDNTKNMKPKLIRLFKEGARAIISIFASSGVQVFEQSVQKHCLKSCDLHYYFSDVIWRVMAEGSVYMRLQVF